MVDDLSVKGAAKRARSPSDSGRNEENDAGHKQAKISPATEEDVEVRSSSPRVVDVLSRGRSPSEDGEERDDSPPLPDEEPPPLPDEEPPTDEPSDDGWEPRWDYNNNAWYYFNRFTGVSQWENPRVPEATVVPPSVAGAPGTESAPGTDGTGHSAVMGPPPSYMGYNPKIHGDFDPNADYAKYHQPAAEEAAEETANDVAPSADDLSEMYQQSATFNRFTGSFQSQDRGPDAHNDENKSKRQMEAFFDVDKAANAHEGRSLKAQRQRQKLSKQQIQEFNNKKKAKKIKKDRDWLTS
ncbi:WSC domain-containing protein 8 [Elsinoe fawcettii]|nr:WSC domain-containing protein 8 [Elsinoe fawcettii]